MLKGKDNINNKSRYKVLKVHMWGKFGGTLGQGGVQGTVLVLKDHLAARTGPAGCGDMRSPFTEGCATHARARYPGEHLPLHPHLVETLDSRKCWKEGCRKKWAQDWRHPPSHVGQYPFRALDEASAVSAQRGAIPLVLLRGSRQTLPTPCSSPLCLSQVPFFFLLRFYFLISTAGKGLETTTP